MDMTISLLPHEDTKQHDLGATVKVVGVCGTK